MFVTTQPFERENFDLRRAPAVLPQDTRPDDSDRDKIVGESDSLRYVMSRIEQVAETDATVLLFGETGTGKELLARAIHRRSRAATGPFVVVNCATLPGALIESELFGRERGAFTGAHATQVGRFELANRGTLFLDEIGELPLELQPKLLARAAEPAARASGQSAHDRRRRPRSIAATNRDLLEEVRQGRFRRDLFYRLNVFPITRAVAPRSPRGHPAARPASGRASRARAAEAHRRGPAVGIARARVVRLAGQHPRARERDSARDHPVDRPHARVERRVAAGAEARVEPRAARRSSKSSVVTSCTSSRRAGGGSKGPAAPRRCSRSSRARCGAGC